MLHCALQSPAGSSAKEVASVSSLLLVSGRVSFGILWQTFSVPASSPYTVQLSGSFAAISRRIARRKAGMLSSTQPLILLSS